MRKRTLLITGVIALPLLLLAVRGLAGAGSRSAEAGAAFPEVSANVQLIASSQSWDIVSKAGFAANRVDVAVGRPDQNVKVRVAGFVCADGTVAEAAEPKGIEPNPTPSSTLPIDEVWSATFPSKCITPGGSVNVTLLSADRRNKLVIKAAHVENTTTLVPQVGTINVRRIGNSRNWKVTFKDPSKGYNRVELYVGRGSGAQKVRRAVFLCQSTHQRVRGELKLNPDVPAPPNQDVWSATFSRKCAGGVRAHFFPVRCLEDAEDDPGETRCDRRNQIVVKGGIAINTTHLVPREGPANPRLKKKTQYFRLTPKAAFAANRIEVDVGTASNAQTIESALFVTGCPGPAVNGSLKHILKNVNSTPGDLLPNHEVWTVEYPTKCIPPLFAPVVLMVPKDASKQVVIKAARFQNTIPPPTATDTPFLTPTPAATETEVPTPVGPLGDCHVVGQNIDFHHDFRTPVAGEVWDSWKCTPAQNIDWNRVDIFIENLSAPQVRKVKAVQFDCQSNHSKANTIIRKGFIKSANQVEVWSGQDFKTARNVPIKNCQGGVSVFLLRADPANKPLIKKAVFSHTGLPKPTPQKPLVSNGSCSASTTALNEWGCSTDPALNVPPFNRVDIKVASPTDQLELAGLQIRCPAAGAVLSAVVDFKGQKVDNGPNSLSPHHEVWSGVFPAKCQGPVVVTLKPFVATSAPRIIGVFFSNIPQPTPTPSKPAANGNCSRVVGQPNFWLCLPKFSSNIFLIRRIDIWVGKPDTAQKLNAATFICEPFGPPAVVVGVPKGQKANDSTQFPFAEQWSADFPDGCQFSIVVLLQPAGPANSPVIKKVVLQ